MIRINLLPVREARRKADLRHQLLMLGGAAFTAMGVAVAVHLQVSSQASRARERVVQLKAQIERFRPQQKQVEEYKKKKEQIEAKLAVIEKLEHSRSGPVRMLDELATRTPERVWLTELDAEGGTVVLSGLSLDPELLARFMTALEESAFFDDVELESSELKSLNQLRLTSFSIKAKLRPPGEATRGAKATKTTAAVGGTRG